MKPTPGEAVEPYFQRLREQAKRCDFDNRIEREVRDQFIMTCQYADLQEKLVEELLLKGKDLTLDEVKSKAMVYEKARVQTKAICNDTSQMREVNKVSRTSSGSKDSMKCFACGGTGHFKKDPQCPAKGKQCSQCGFMDHFDKQCRAKKETREKFQKSKKSKSFRFKKRYKTVRLAQGEEVQITDEDSSGDEEPRVNATSKYAFPVNAAGGKIELYPIQLGGRTLEVLIDSGANTNVMGESYYKGLKKQDFEVIRSDKAEGRVRVYGNMYKGVVGTFVAQTQNRAGKSLTTRWTVIEGSDIPILCRGDSEALGLLVVARINMVSSSEIEKKYPEAFKGVGKLKDFKLRIPVDPDVKPVAQPLRRVHIERLKPMEKLLFELLDQDIIERVDGPTPRISPAHIVPKGKEEWRLCVDMREANKCVKRERFPIKTLDELLVQIGQFRVVSKTDFKLAFHQLELEEDSRELSTFSTPFGIFRYKRLWFGMLSAQEYLVKTLTMVFLNVKGVTIAFDDAIITGKSVEEHNENLENFMKVIIRKNLTLNGRKTRIGVQEVTFMGQIMSPDGIRPAEGTQKEVIDFRSPANVTELQSFLGLVNFVARYVPDMATLLEPLRALCRKGCQFKWSAPQEEAFLRIKGKMADPPVLCFYDREAKTAVITDASPVGLGAVLVQIQGKGASECPRIVKYCHKALSDRERKYSQTEKEALGAVWACEHLRFYLLDKKFSLITDCKALEYIFSPSSKPCMRLERWAMRLQAFDYVVVHKPGKTNIADPLSRLIKDVDLKCKHQKTGEENMYALYVMTEQVPMAMTVHEVREESNKDPVLSEVMTSLRTGRWPKELRYYEILQMELAEVHGVLTRGKRIVIPGTLKQRVLELAHEGHLGATAMRARLRTKVWWKGMDADAERYATSCKSCQFVGKPDPPQPMSRTELPQYAWQYVGIDHMGPLPVTQEYLFVIIDYFSRFMEVEVTKSTGAKESVKLLRPHFARYGPPELLISDQAQGFKDEDIFNQFLREEGTHHEYSTPMWPQANGEVERANRSLLKRLKIAQLEKRDWKRELLRYLASYRTTPHATTGQPPAKLFFNNRNIRSKLPELRDGATVDEEVKDRDRYSKAQGKLYADQKRRAQRSEVQAGDTVLVQQPRENKLSTPFHHTPMSVVRREGAEVDIRNPETGGVYTRNTSAVKKVKEVVRNPETHTNDFIVSGRSPGHLPDNAQDVGVAEGLHTDQHPNQGTSPKGQVQTSPKSRPQRERKQPGWFKDFEMSGVKE